MRVRATSKSWLYRYKSDEKQVKIGLGAYPTVTLTIARTLTKEANALRAQGIDPQDARREQQEQAKIAKMNTFELMARAWLEVPARIASGLPATKARSLVIWRFTYSRG
ncbi:MAG: integrase arm-type DNA-binding domain-containing protein [Pigmentiphaga sp.]|nr:integrase arm-type DNA-binding domain-containing protein [Pigmentiphaga sp.]